MDDGNIAAESICAHCGARAEVGQIFCKHCGVTLRPVVPLVASVTESPSTCVPILADAIGLVLIAVQFILVFRWLVPNDGTRFITGGIAYAILAAVALGMWHGKEASERFSDTHDWAGVMIGSILLGCMSFGVDILVGSSTHPGMSPIEAGTKAGSPFGFILTIFLCPGVTMVAVAGLIRSFLEHEDDTPV